MKGRIKRGSYRVLVGPEGIAVRHRWHGTRLLPWHLIGSMAPVLLPWGGGWRVQLVLADGSMELLPAPWSGKVNRDARFERALEALNEGRREHRTRQSPEPQDAVPPEYRDEQVRRLSFRGGLRRNGLLQLGLAIFGLLGVWGVVNHSRLEFGPAGLFGPPATCTSAQVLDGTASQAWCTVTDAELTYLHTDKSTGVTTVDFAPSSASTPLSTEFSGQVPAYRSLRVGDKVTYVAQNGLGIDSFTWNGTTTYISTATSDNDGTVATRRAADVAGFAAALAWPVFFGLWALRLWRPRRTRAISWALPSIAAAWLTGLVNYAVDSGAPRSAPASSIVLEAAVFTTVFTAGYVYMRATRIPDEVVARVSAAAVGR